MHNIAQLMLVKTKSIYGILAKLYIVKICLNN